MRENLLRDLAIRAATDPEFLAKVRQDARGTFARYGYDLTEEDLRSVKDLRRRTAGIDDREFASRCAVASEVGPASLPPGASQETSATRRFQREHPTILSFEPGGRDLGDPLAFVSPGHGSGAMYRSTAQKWQALPATTKRCHSSWNPKTPGKGSGRFRPYTSAPPL